MKLGEKVGLLLVVRILVVKLSRVGVGGARSRHQGAAHFEVRLQYVVEGCATALLT